MVLSLLILKLTEEVLFQFSITNIEYDPIEIIAQCIITTSRTIFSKTPMFEVKLSELDLVRMIEQVHQQYDYIKRL